MNNKFNFEDYPSCYQASDIASINAQKYYINLIRFDLIFMILGALLTIYNIQEEHCKIIIYLFSAIFLLVSFILSIIIRTRKFEDIWYQSRALAESIKTLTWRYLTCSELFEKKITNEEVDKLFKDRIKELLFEFKNLNVELDAKILLLPIISERMRELRILNTNDRKNFYITNRIIDQKEWYSSKAEFNKKKYNLWFGLIIVFQFLSILSVLLLLVSPNFIWNLVGLFTTISSTSISWLQLKQHQELKQAYTTATLELNLIHELSNQIITDDDLSKFVLDSENAISREHTLWLAQKRRS